jgi:methyl acetate hydrolase
MENVDALLESAVDLENVAGVVAMVTAHGCENYAGEYGRRSRDDAATMSTDTIFEVSSMVRPIMTVAALTLVESGELDLDDPLGAVLPALRAPTRQAGFTMNGRAAPKAVRGRLTLRTLLNHTSGLTHLDQAGALLGAPGQGALPLLFDPGTRWHHGGDLSLVGAVIERVTGAPVDEYLRTAIFDVLGMDDTGFDVEYSARRRVAGGWRELAGNPGETAFYSTPRDYFAFVEALLRRRGSLLSQQSFDLVHSNQIGALTVPTVLGLDAVRVPGEINYYPEIRLYPDVPRKWSLGFMVNDLPSPGGPRAGSLTCAAPARGYCWIDPVSGVAGVLFARHTPTYPDLVDLLFADLQRAAYVSQAVRLSDEPRRRRGVERLFEGWSREAWTMWWPM